MAVTSPDNIWSPDAGDDYALTVDLAAMADTVQDAIDSVRGGTGSRRGTNTERDASAPTTGDLWVSTNDGYVYRWSGTTWLYAPGQVIGNFSYTGANSGGGGSPVGGTAVTPSLPVGQRVKITSRISQYLTVAGTTTAAMAALSGGGTPTNTAFDARWIIRDWLPGSSVVGSSVMVATHTVTSAGVLRVGITNNNVNTWSIYGAEGLEIIIESI